MIPIINKDPSSHMYKNKSVFKLVMGTLGLSTFNIPYSSVNCSSHVVYYILSIYLPFKFIPFNNLHTFPSPLPSDNHKSDLLLWICLKKFLYQTAFIIVWLCSLSTVPSQSIRGCKWKNFYFLCLKIYVYILENFFSHVGMYT